MRVRRSIANGHTQRSDGESPGGPPSSFADLLAEVQKQYDEVVAERNVLREGMFMRTSRSTRTVSVIGGRLPSSASAKTDDRMSAVVGVARTSSTAEGAAAGNHRSAGSIASNGSNVGPSAPTVAQQPSEGAAQSTVSVRFSVLPEEAPPSRRRSSSIPLLEANDDDEDMDNSDEEDIFPEWKSGLGSGGFTRQKSPLMERGSSAASGDRNSVLQDSGVPGALTNRWVLSPLAWPRLAWDLTACMCVLYEFWVTPFGLVFVPELPASLALVDILVTTFFCMDILLNFNTGYLDEVSEQLVMRRGLIAQRYLTGWFWVDLVGTIPFDKILAASNSSVFSLTRVAKASRILRGTRYLKLVRAWRLMYAMKTHVDLESGLRRVATPCAMVLGALALAHVHCCVLVQMQPEEFPPVTEFDDALQNYFHSFCQMYNAFLLGTPLPAHSPMLSALAMIVATERGVIIVSVMMWGILQAQMIYEQQARFSWEMDEVLVYLRNRSVSKRMQQRVLRQLMETSRVRGMKQKFDAWRNNDGMPVELHRAICEELWLPRLQSIGLLRCLKQMDPSFLSELAMKVREDTYVGKSTLFSEGDESLAAYCIVAGRLTLSSQRGGVEQPDFTDGMWVGEKALVCPYMPRTVTAFVQTTSTLMAIPAQDFRELLLTFDLLKEFEDECCQVLDSGVCGRCGDIGSHFANECVQTVGRSEVAGRQARWLPLPDVFVTQCRTCTFRTGGAGGAAAGADYAPLGQRHAEVVKAGAAARRELRNFIREHRLKASVLVPALESRGVKSLEEISQLEPNAYQTLISDLCCELGLESRQLNPRVSEAAFAPMLDDADSPQASLREVFSAAAIESFRSGGGRRAPGSRERAMTLIEVRDQHLIFLSHSKAEAGAEAALLRNELEALIPKKDELRLAFEVPVFLDSEDLKNLEALQEHVINSHNLVLMLTKGVLLRPWCIVEIATAVRHGIPVVPVQVMKAGGEFKFPDEEFYAQLPHQIGTAGTKVLEACEVTAAEAVEAIKKVFQRISLTYSPQRSKKSRQPELEAILSNCAARGSNHASGGHHGKGRNFRSMRQSVG